VQEVFYEAPGKTTQQAVLDIWLLQISAVPGTYLYFCLTTDEFERFKITQPFSLRTTLHAPARTCNWHLRFRLAKSQTILLPIANCDEVCQVYTQTLFAQRLILVFRPHPDLTRRRIAAALPLAELLPTTTLPLPIVASCFHPDAEP